MFLLSLPMLFTFVLPSAVAFKSIVFFTLAQSFSYQLLTLLKTSISHYEILRCYLRPRGPCFCQRAGKSSQWYSRRLSLMMLQKSTVLAACGTACASGPAPDVTVTRSSPSMSEGTPCPSLIVSSMSMNGSNPTMTSINPPVATFTGAANHVSGPVGAALALAVAAFAL